MTQEAREPLTDPTDRPDAIYDVNPIETPFMAIEAQKLFTIAVEDPENEAQVAVARECQEMARFLIGKNKAYGNSVLEPARIFSSSPANEQIKVRIDDKLSRLQSQALFGGDDEDTLKDLIGYLIYLKIARRKNDA